MSSRLSYYLGVALALSPLAAAAEGFSDGTLLYGYKNGVFYELSPEGATKTFDDAGYKSSWYVTLNTGWLNDGKFQGYRTDAAGSRLWELSFVEIDWATGEQISSTSLSTSNGFLTYAAYDPTTRTIFGYGYDSSRTRAFMKASVDAPGDFTVIKTYEDDAEVCFGLTWSTAEASLVGMLANGQMVKVAPDGTQTLMLSTGYTTSSDGSIDSYLRSQPLAWSELGGVYYWLAEARDMESDSFMVIDAANTSLSNFPDYTGGMFAFLLADKGISASAPKAPELVSFNFEGGATSGNIIITLPTEAMDGSALEGELSWTAAVDGTEYTSGTATAGSDVTVEFADVADGTHTFTFTASTAAETGSELSFSRYIGLDTPKAPADVVLTNTLLTWAPVTEGVNGGYVDPSAITYEVALGDQIIGTTAETSMEMNIPTTGPLSIVRATVYALAGELRSAGAESNPVDAGAAFETPVDLVPTPEQAQFFKTIDGYDDGKTWTYDENNQYFMSGYNASQEMDEWLVLPPVELKAGGHYRFTFRANRLRSFFDEEYLEVGLGTAVTAESLSQTIVLDKFQVPYEREEWQTITASVEVAETGIYYLGLHAVSAPDMANILVKDFSIVNTGMENASPEAVTDITAEAAPDGELKAFVTFTMPTTTIKGEPLDNSTVITATVACENTVTVEGLPGQQVSATVETRQGDNTISVTTAIGDVVGNRALVNVFTGEAIPGAVQNLTVTQSADFRSLTLTWEPPVTGADGTGFINPDNLTYSIRILKETLLGDFYDDLETGLTECSYTFTAPAEALDYYAFAVVAQGPSGLSPVIAENGGVLGTPYTLPMVEDFTAAGVYTYQPWVTYLPTPDYVTRWFPLPLESIPGAQEDAEFNQWALTGQGMRNGCLGRAGFPVFSTAGRDKVSISLDVWTGYNAASDIRITGEAYGMTEPVLVGNVTAPVDSNWANCEFAFPDELLGREWVKLYLEASFPQGMQQWVVMTRYTIDETVALATVGADASDIVIKAVDGAVTVAAPEAVAVSVYNVAGTLVAVSEASTAHTIALPAGLYIVRAADRSAKVALK